jgi:hypothetical protein
MWLRATNILRGWIAAMHFSCRSQRWYRERKGQKTDRRVVFNHVQLLNLEDDNDQNRDPNGLPEFSHVACVDEDNDKLGVDYDEAGTSEEMDITNQTSNAPCEDEDEEMGHWLFARESKL